MTTNIKLQLNYLFEEGKIIITITIIDNQFERLISDDIDIINLTILVQNKL